MSKEALDKNIDELLNVIEACLNNKIILPSLILLYSGIDIMAWLSRPDNQNDVKPDDFYRWAKEYILPNGNLTCSEIDLYAARCALIHSYTSESRLSRKGEAKQICYAWGTANDKYLQKLINRSSKKNTYIAVHINELFKAFRSGVLTYKKALSNDQEKASLVYKRASKFFTFIDIPSLAPKE